MNRKIKIKFMVGNQVGSISLEGAIVIPICMIVLLVFCQLIYAYNAEMNLRSAAETAAREAGLALATAGLWEDLPQTATTYISTRTNLDLPYVLDEWILELSAAEIGSSFILNRIRDFYEADVRYPAIGRKLISDPALRLSLDSDESILWFDLAYQVKLMGLSFQREIRQPVVLWHALPELREEVANIPSSIWSMDNFSRGMVFQSIFGRNLPYNYPVFSSFEFGRASSIMSIDLTAPSYSDHAAIRRNIESELYAIANYDYPGASWESNKCFFTNDDIHTRVLIVIIPTNSPSELLEVVESTRYLSQEIGINLIVKRAAESLRYIE